VLQKGPGLITECVYVCVCVCVCGLRWEVLPQDVFADKPAVVTVGAGDEDEDLPGALHAAQPGLDRVGAGLQVPARVPLHTGEVRPCVRCMATQAQ